MKDRSGMRKVTIVLLLVKKNSFALYGHQTIFDCKKVHHYCANSVSAIFQECFNTLYTCLEGEGFISASSR